MKTETYNALLKDLQRLQKTIVASQIVAVRRDQSTAARMARLHIEAEVGGRVDDFVATVARKSTVLFLLRTVFVRVLEDLGILGLKRIRDDWGFAAFREVAPALGLRSYFAFVFRDLATDFPALFTPGDDELPLPDEDSCRALWNLWHHPNRDGERYTWNGDGFESRFLGDLYQDLDADIRKRYALKQTPRFIEEYILDHSLTPALGVFDPATLRASGETFRVLDPTCGSGHFLIGVFYRLADYWRNRHGLAEWEACERALECVWGCDINTHAIEIAAFRLLLEVVARTRVTDLERLARLEIKLRTLDSLIPWERANEQGELFSAKDRLDAYATPRQRTENAEFLAHRFYVIVGNPPYITPKEVRKKEDYRLFWPDSCYMRYALSAPFAERILSLGIKGAFTGQITANSFMKRQFGVPLIEKVFPRFDLTAIVDTSGANIPGHGTPTVILFGRNQSPSRKTIRGILGKRGEPKRPTDPAQGLVWSAIASASTEDDDTSPFISVSTLAREQMQTHPWSLGGGAAGELRTTIEAAASLRLLPDVAARIGLMTILKQDDIYFHAPPGLAPGGRCSVGIVEGTYIRDYAIARPDKALFPYNASSPTQVLILDRDSPLLHFFWRYRGILRQRTSTGFRTILERGLHFYEYPFYFPETYAGPAITFAFVATHNHFALSHGGYLFKQSAPVVKLPATKTLDDYLDVLGLLNSSTLGFWMKQVFHNKGEGGGTRVEAGHSAAGSEEWKNHYEYDSTKLQQAPISTRDRVARVDLARALDTATQDRARCLPAALLASNTWTPRSLGTDISKSHEHFLVHTRRMVALQEELDWLTYSSYGLVDPVPVVASERIEPLSTGHRPFEIVLARQDDEADEDEKSAWWSRHGHERVTKLPDSYSESHRARLQQRIDLIESDARLALLESPPYKRRWQLSDWTSETKQAAESWLLDRMEDLFAPASGSAGGPLKEPRPYRLEDIASAWSRDPRVAAVAGVWSGTGESVDLTLVAERLLRTNALPDNPHRVYSDEGLRKLAEWKRVWALQDQEDAWERAKTNAEIPAEATCQKRLVDPDDPMKELEAIPLPPKFDKNDFLRPEYFSVRGKLNVERERFVLFADLSPNRFGWNGWRNRDRAIAQVEAFTLAENDPQQPLPVPTSDDPRRCGVTFGMWENLPDVRRWEPADEHAELHALAREACRQSRCPCPIVEAWKAQVLNGKAADQEPRTAKKKSKVKLEAAVSLAARAWVVSLLPPGKELDTAGVWARHIGRLGEAPQLALPNVSHPAVQLAIPLTVTGASLEHASLDEAQLARVLDDLVASGDIQVAGRGKKKRFQLIARGVSA